MASQSKAAQFLSTYMDGLAILADGLGLRWFIDDSEFTLKFYLQEKGTGKRAHGPFKDFDELEEKLNSLHLARISPGQLS